MVTLTRPEADAQLVATVDLQEEVRFKGESAVKSVLSLIDAIDVVGKGDFNATLIAAARNYRTRYSAVLAGDTALLTPVLRHFMRFLGKQATDPRAMLDELYDDFVANAITIRSRGFVLATPPAFTGTGNGVLLRLTVDENNFAFEHGIPDTKTGTITRDVSTGSQIHEEVLTLEGATPSVDLLDFDLGSGQTAFVTALTFRNAATLQNAGFRQLTSALPIAVGSPRVLTAAPAGWEITAGVVGDLTGQADLVFRTLQGESLATALRWTGNVTIRQLLRTNGVQLVSNVPHMVGVAIVRENSATGTVTLSLGTSSVVKDLSTMVNGVYEFVPIALGTGYWFENFNETDLDVEVAAAALAVGQFSISEVILAPGVFFDGSWYWLIGGTIAFLRDDVSAFTDTDGGTGKIQRTQARAFGHRTLPHAVVPTLADPP